MTQVWAGMVSLLERSHSRTAAIESLLPQVDRVSVTQGGHGAVAKFDICRNLPAGDVFLGVDDDLIYPPDYVKHTLRWLDRFPDCIVSHHGFTIDSEGNRRLNWRCLDAVEEPAEAHVIGTGVCAFRVETIRPLVPEDFPDMTGPDPWLAVLAERKGVRRIVLPHPERWFGYFEARQTMWTETTGETGSMMDASGAVREGCRILSELIPDLPDPEVAEDAELEAANA